MRHRSNTTASIFVKKNLEDTLPPIVLELVNQLEDMPNLEDTLPLHYVEHVCIGTKVELNSQI